MTSRFADMFSRTASPGLTRWFGESAVYYPGGDTDAARPIQAIVDRMPVTMPAEFGGTVAMLELRIRVRDSSVDGIAFDEIDAGSDEIGIALRPGGDLERRRIVGQPELNGGLVRLRVR